MPWIFAAIRISLRAAGHFNKVHFVLREIQRAPENAWM
jgi:hypothetical protein